MTRDWKGDLAWYKAHQNTAEIGFNPDGQCLKVCRTSRDVGPKYLTAKECQDAVPKEYRHYRPRDLRKGMKLFFDDPSDSNTAGHIVTMIGRVKGFDWDELNDILVETNSVVSGQLVVVRATYFLQHWGDQFQFGANWINGVVLDYAGSKQVKDQPELSHRLSNFRESGNDWNVRFLDRAVEAGRKDMAPKVAQIEKLVDQLPDDDGDTAVKKFKKSFKEDRVLKMRLLNEAVDSGRTGTVMEVRNGLRAAIKSVLFS